jgi:hypothetical protein
MQQILLFYTICFSQVVFPHVKQTSLIEAANHSSSPCLVSAALGWPITGLNSSGQVHLPKMDQCLGYIKKKHTLDFFFLSGAIRKCDNSSKYFPSCKEKYSLEMPTQHGQVTN